MSAKLLVVILNGVGRKLVKLYLGLAGTGTLTSLSNNTILGPRRSKVKENATVYKTQVGKSGLRRST